MWARLMSARSVAWGGLASLASVGALCLLGPKGAGFVAHCAPRVGPADDGEDELVQRVATFKQWLTSHGGDVETVDIRRSREVRLAWFRGPGSLLSQNGSGHLNAVSIVQPKLEVGYQAVRWLGIGYWSRAGSACGAVYGRPDSALPSVLAGELGWQGHGRCGSNIPTEDSNHANKHCGTRCYRPQAGQQQCIDRLADCFT